MRQGLKTRWLAVGVGWFAWAMAVAMVMPGRGADLGGAGATAAVDLATSIREGTEAIRKFRIAPGFKAELVAADPQLKNVVAFGFNEQGDIFTSETERYRSSALDIRHYMSWYDDDLAARTVEDRVAVVRKHLGTNWTKMLRETESIRWLQDTNGDGQMDLSRVFASGFTNVLDGIASGVMARHGKVYFTSIPDLWLLSAPETKRRNTGGARSKGQPAYSYEGATERKSVAHGFGVHFSLTGHDLHGLTMGPDGKVYFTVGDRGTHVVTREGVTLDLPDEGACFRMDPDGWNLELFCRGLRNPQELAFDEFGNLFTGENDCDHGDRERWVHLTEGTDHGWRIGYQFSEQKPGGAWMSERLWWTNFPGRAFYCPPPVAHIENGPSGICYYPGTGLEDRFLGTFFVTHFKGVDNLSGIRMLKVRPRGAGFELAEDSELIWNALPTDVDFSPDGHIHFSDWVHGWPKSERGRMYRLTYSKPDPRAAETARLLRDGMGSRTARELGRLLDHPDMRVRLEAQYELVARVVPPRRGVLKGDGREGWVYAPEQLNAAKSREALGVLILVATKRDLESLGPRVLGTTVVGPRARRHAIWALGQLLSQQQTFGDVRWVERLLADTDTDIQLQALRVLGNATVPFLTAIPEVAEKLRSPDAAVRAAAAVTLGKLNRPSLSFAWSPGLRERISTRLNAGLPADLQIPTPDHRDLRPLFAALRRETVGDPVLLHAYVQGLVVSSNLAAVVERSGDSHPVVRLACLLAMRTWKTPAITNFLFDPDPLLVVEAARAINDMPIPGAVPALAALLEKRELWEAVLGAKGRSDRAIPGASAGDILGTEVASADYDLLVRRPLLRRIMNAVFRGGEPAGAIALARLANGEIPGGAGPWLEEYRSEALLMLGQWGKPSARDKVLGLWWPLPGRDGGTAVTALRAKLPGLIGGGGTDGMAPVGVQAAAIRAIATLGMGEAVDRLVEMAGAAGVESGVRVEALRAAVSLVRGVGGERGEKVTGVLTVAAADPDATVRREAVRLSASNNATAATPELARVLVNGSISDKQAALSALASIPGTVADEIIYGQLRPWVEGEPTPPELQLDILEASEARQDERIKQWLGTYREKLPKNDPLASSRVLLKGGNAEAGRKVFLERAEASCVRCHRIAGEGGEVGPELTGIGSRQTREYLLESLLMPNARIAAGFESVMVTLKSGQAVAGVLKEETPDALVISSPEDGVVRVKPSEVTNRTKGLSGMPEGLGQVLSRSDIRDLLEFLASLK